MYVHSVKLVNFKSIGDYEESEVILEPKVTSIIGKNESGKSNVLEGLSMISLRGRNTNAFSRSLSNRIGVSESPIKYIVVLKFSANEVEETGIAEDTKIEITETEYLVTGGLLTYFRERVHPCFSALVNELREANNPWGLKDIDLSNYRKYLERLSAFDNIDVPRINEAIASISKRITSKKDERFSELQINADESWNNFKRFLPTFFYRKADKHLKTIYKLDEVKKELETPSAFPNSLLYDFVKLINIPSTDFIMAVQSGTNGAQVSTRKRIQRNISNLVNSKFSEFYKTESVQLQVDFNESAVIFSVQSNEGETLLLSERSNGLRWYLETFIDAQAHGISGKNVVYLFDEPGTSLHVNAQRELITLFQHLADQGNQVAFTTHSPYMLDTENEGIHRIRAVVKDSNGYSRIYKTAYDSRILPEQHQDTLAPIIYALGMNLSDTFGPSKDKINIVTEGMSDYIFLCAMAKILNIDTEKIAIIPAVGASECVNLCCILRGWGCKFIALFDFDKAGVETGAEILRKDYLFELNKHYCFMKEVSQEDIDNKAYRKKFMIEDVVTHEEIDRFYQETGRPSTIGKVLTAKLMCNDFEKGRFVFSETCKDNFLELFGRILRCAKSI